MSLRGLLTDLALSTLAALIGVLVGYLSGSAFADGYVFASLAFGFFRVGTRTFRRDPSKCPHERVHCDRCDTTWLPVKLSQVEADRWNRRSR